jgi:hypothetical protein
MYPQARHSVCPEYLQDKVFSIFRNHVFCSEHLTDKVLSAYLMHTSANECSVCSEDKCPKNDVLMYVATWGRVSKQVKNGYRRKTCDIRTWEKIFISRHILHQHLSHSFPMRRYPRNISRLTVVSAISAPPIQRLHYQRNLCHSIVNRFTGQRLPTINKTFIYEYPFHRVLFPTKSA